jgi:catechol 2,3-dioxygenase-like lactoylglutathione lyase family enzyme
MCSLALFAALVVACTSTPAPVVTKEELSMPQPAARAFAYVVISVADMDQALGLWVQRFGMQIVSRRSGSDPGLAQIWGLNADAIVDQALLLTPGATEGGVHLVRFAFPGPAVRSDAQPTDLVPKSVDIAVRDIEARYAELEAAGYKFRSKVGTLETDGIVVREVHMPAHDALNLVFLEIEGDPELVSPQGYGIAPQIIATTADNLADKVFYESVFGMVEASYHRFAGAAIEKTVGLPKGAGLDVRIFGDPASRYGRLELVQYEGVKSANLYPRAVPPARGMLSVVYFVPDLTPIVTRGTGYGLRERGVVSTIWGQGRVAQVTSPAGLRIDIVESPRSR